MSTFTLVSGNDFRERRNILIWFAGQADSIQLEIFSQKNNEAARLQTAFPHLKPAALELAGLIHAIRNSGWDDENAYSRGKRLSPEAVRRIAIRRHARSVAHQPHRLVVRRWLNMNWGKVMDMRRAGLSWRRVSEMIAADHGVRISHSSLIAVRLRGKKKVQNLKGVWYKEFAKHHATQGDFGLESP